MEAVKMWLEELTADDMPEPYKQIAMMIGVTNTVTLAETFGGSHLYLPKYDSAIRALRDRKIREAFNGYNYKQLARKFDLSEQWVREIVASVDYRDPNQADLFDFLRKPN